MVDNKTRSVKSIQPHTAKTHETQNVVIEKVIRIRFQSIFFSKRIKKTVLNYVKNKKTGII